MPRFNIRRRRPQPAKLEETKSEVSSDEVQKPVDEALVKQIQ